MHKGFISTTVVIAIGASLLAGALGSWIYIDGKSELNIGAPASQHFRNLLPFADQTYDLGTTTPALEWNNVYTKDLTVSGTCTGCGGGSTVFGDLGDVATSSDATGDIYYLNSSGQIVNLGAGSNGQVLKLSAGIPSWGTDNSGGGGGSGLWATTTDSLVVYPTDTTDVVVVGNNATTSIGYAFEVIGSSLFDAATFSGAITGNLTGNVTGNADTATALAANGANCLAGEIALGVDASGAVEGCYEPTEADITDLSHFTGSDFWTFFNATTTDFLTEGSTNFYATQTRWDSFWNASTTLTSPTSIPNLSITESQISDLTHTTDTNLTQEEVEDFAGALTATGGTKTGITVTYQDATNDMDFVTDVQTSDLHSAVTVSGAYDYITLTGQDIVRGLIDMATDITNFGTPFYTFFNATTTDALTEGSTNLYNQTHTGEVTGSTALTIASNIVDEDNLKLDTTPTDNYLLIASSSASGGMDWVATSSPLLNLGTGGGGAETNSLETTITGILDTEFFVGNGADSGTFVAMSGDATLANTGALTIASNAIDPAMLANSDFGDWTCSAGTCTLDTGTVDSTAILDNTIQAVDLEATNVEADNDIVTYDSATGGFTFNLASEIITAGTGLSWTANTLNAEVQTSDLHNAVTLSGTPNYLTLSGQDIVRAKLDISDDTNATGGVGVDITLNDFTLDLTELSTATFGAGAFTTLTFNAGAVDPVITASSGHIDISTGDFSVASTTMVGDFAVGDGVNQATSTFSGSLFVEDPTATGTSTIYVKSDTAGFGGEIILEDSDGAGCSSLMVLDGVVSAVTVTCPVWAIE